MRKAARLLTLSTLMFGLASISASAQTQITLNGTSSGQIIFTATGGGNLSMGLGGCTDSLNGICGTATGTGALSSSGNYVISGGGSPYTLTKVGSGVWSASGSLLFTYKDSLGNTLLSGTLSQVSLKQDGSSGTIKTILTANLTGATGSLANGLGSGITTVYITLTGAGNTPLPDFSSLAASAIGTIYTGDVDPPPAKTPEPASALLLGCGLGAIGVAALRCRKRSPPG
jgi:hypothetical protein